MEIKTAEEILETTSGITPHASTPNLYRKEDIIKIMKEYAKQFIDYASENVEVNINIIDSKQDCYVNLAGIEVYVPKGEFDKIKELIK